MSASFYAGMQQRGDTFRSANKRGSEYTDTTQPHSTMSHPVSSQSHGVTPRAHQFSVGCPLMDHVIAPSDMDANRCASLLNLLRQQSCRNRPGSSQHYLCVGAHEVIKPGAVVAPLHLAFGLSENIGPSWQPPSGRRRPVYKIVGVQCRATYIHRR